MSEKSDELNKDLLRYEPFMRFDYPPSFVEYIKVNLECLIQCWADHFCDNFSAALSFILHGLFNVFGCEYIMLYKMCTTRNQYQTFQFLQNLVYSKLRGVSKFYYDFLVVLSRCGLFCGGYLIFNRRKFKNLENLSEKEGETKPLLESVSHENDDIVIDIQRINEENQPKNEKDEELMSLMEEIEKIRESKIIKEKPPCLIISNHLSMADVLFSIEEFGMTSFVARGNLVSFPFFGPFLKQIECILVESGSQVQRDILKRQINYYKNESSQRLVIFPEGTTTNGKFILPFKKGAFFAGLPVQIMIIKHKWDHFQPTWETIPEKTFYFRLFTQFRNYVEITHLPVYYPNEDEIKDPELYADNVRNLMAKVSGLKLSSSTREDKLEFHNRILAGEFTWDKNNLN